MLSRIIRIVAMLALATAAPAWAQCEPAWGPVGGGVSGIVETLAVFDDGSGPALYAGGNFTIAGGTAANNVAKWDGMSWSPLGTGTSSRVLALAVYDDGSGSALYAGGKFTTAGGIPANFIAKWDGTSWSPVGAGMSGSSIANVKALTVFDDGSGAALYAGGIFPTAGAIGANNIARWDGTSWSPLGTGTDRNVHALMVFDDGSGAALYAGGLFEAAGGIGASRIAKWDGTSWSPLGTGVNNLVRALTVFDDGSGPALYTGGFFTVAGGVAASYVAKWDGASWSPFGGAGGGVNDAVHALTVFNDGSGLTLRVGGRFTQAGGLSANHIAEWDGTSWSPLGGGVNWDVFALAVFSDGLDAALYAGGQGQHIMARWGVPIPSVTRPPADRTVEVRMQTSFTLQAVSTPGPMSIQWHKDGQPLLEDPPRITGTRGPTLRIDAVVLGDAGLYDAVITNVCGPARTRSAMLTVTCYADCDQSTGPGVLDIFDFLCFQSSFVSFGAYADCDGNNLLDIFDFLCFQNAFVAGCP